MHAQRLKGLRGVAWRARLRRRERLRYARKAAAAAAARGVQRELAEGVAGLK
jgi:hypothetical protein